jgi:predicted DCC family thiol-disulfide oxidoreductase YuxK
MNPLAILYDGTCTLCVASKRRLERWPRSSEMRFVALQDPEARSLLPGLSEAELLGAMHVVEEGRVWSGADAWFRVMRLAPLRIRWLAWITPRWLARPVYRWIARKRHAWFGRAEGCQRGSCPISASAGTASSKRNGSRGPGSPGP